MVDHEQYHNTTIIKLWLPTFVAAHVFCGYWIAKAVFNANPQWGCAIRRCFGCGTIVEKEALPQLSHEEDWTPADSPAGLRAPSPSHARLSGACGIVSL